MQTKNQCFFVCFVFKPRSKTQKNLIILQVCIQLFRKKCLFLEKYHFLHLYNCVCIYYKYTHISPKEKKKN